MTTLRDVLTKLSNEQNITLRDSGGNEYDPWDYMAEADDEELDREACITGTSDGRQVRLAEGGYIMDNCEPWFWIVQA